MLAGLWSRRSALLCTLPALCIASSYEEIAHRIADQLINPQGPVNEKRLAKLFGRKIDKMLLQAESSYVLPCIFMHEKGFAVMPNTVCKGLSKEDTASLLSCVEKIAKLTCVMTFESEDSPCDCVKDVGWIRRIYHDHLQRSYAVIDGILERFAAGGLRVADFVCEVKRAVLDGGYVQEFAAELNRKVREMRILIDKRKIEGNMTQILMECKNCKIYASTITTEVLKMSLRQQEMCCGVFVKAFPDDEDGLKLLAEIYSIPVHNSGGTLNCEMFKTSSCNIGKIFDLYRSHGEDVAAGALRMCLLNPGPDTVLDVNSEHIRALKDKEEKRREALDAEFDGPDMGKKKKKKRAKALPNPPAYEDQEVPAERCIFETGYDEDPEKHVCSYRVLRSVIRSSPGSSKNRRSGGQHMQRDLHDLADAVHILEEDDAADYFFKTQRGMSALATLEADGQVARGILEIGLRDDGRTVYHLAFNPKKMRMEKVLSPEFEDACEDSSEDTRCAVRCRITRVGVRYIVRYADPSEESHTCRQLVLYPYRSKSAGEKQ